MKSLPLEIREIRATEARLQQIYDAARLGLKGDSLALASGMLPVEYRRLCQLDPIAEMAAQKGKADAEMAHAGKLSEASMNGDAKASLAILQHVHGWTAKQEISVDVYQKISVITALEEARARLTYVEEVKDGDYQADAQVGQRVDLGRASPANGRPRNFLAVSRHRRKT